MTFPCEPSAEDQPGQEHSQADRRRPEPGRRRYRPDDLVNGRFATRLSGPFARQIALALKGYRLSGAVRAAPLTRRSGPWAVTATRMAWKDYTRAVDTVRGYYWGLHDQRRRGRSLATARKRHRRPRKH
jgi:hypothetical protein